MATYDDLNVPRIAVISVLSVVTTAVTILAIQVLYYAMAQYVENQKIEQATYARSQAVLTQQAEEVSSFGVDESTGNITVPVDSVIRQMASRVESDEV